MNLEIYRKPIQKLVYFMLPIILVVGAITLNNKWIFGKYGSAAFILLAGNLFLRPISVLFRNKLFNYLSTYRREFGVASFWFYLFHASGMYLAFGLSPSSFLNTNSFLFWAGMASPIMWLLFLTSNDKAVRFFGRNWKRLHRLAYPLFFFALIHSSLVDGEVGKIILLGLPFIILKILEYRKIPFSW